MGTETVGDISHLVIRVVCNQTIRAVSSAETNHFLMMVLDALLNSISVEAALEVVQAVVSVHQQM